MAHGDFRELHPNSVKVVPVFVFKANLVRPLYTADSIVKLGPITEKVDRVKIRTTQFLALFSVP